MRFLILIALGLLSLSAQAEYTVMDLIEADELHWKDSRGPSYKKELEADMIERWETVDDFYNLFDDGMNHVAMERADCSPDDRFTVLDVDFEFPELSALFHSIKKNGKGRTVAYALEPLATYSFEYEVIDETRIISTVVVECSVSYGKSFFYKNTKDKTVEYLGFEGDID